MVVNSCRNSATAGLPSALDAQGFSWHAGMTDEGRPWTEAHDKRELAALVRRVAATMSLKADRDALLAQAAAIEAEAERIEKAGRE